ncbi:MAG TPA: hypothetical protein VFH58_04675 [Acidimicrobiales bacterium]|nr:hypothetical protein [Acidimicrobiales bacterium]
MAEAEAQNNQASIPQLAQELRAMVVAYFKQETLDPFKSLGRFLTRAIPGAILTTTGVVVLLVGVLRLLQAETGTVFHGNMSALPYVITLLTGLAIAGLAARAIVSGGKAG